MCVCVCVCVYCNMGVWIYIRVYTILAYCIVSKHIKYHIANCIILQTKSTCVFVFL